MEWFFSAEQSPGQRKTESESLSRGTREASPALVPHLLQILFGPRETTEPLSLSMLNAAYSFYLSIFLFAGWSIPCVIDHLLDEWRQVFTYVCIVCLLWWWQRKQKIITIQYHYAVIVMSLLRQATGVWKIKMLCHPHGYSWNTRSFSSRFFFSFLFFFSFFFFFF